MRACATLVRPDSLAAQARRWSAGLPGPRFSLSQQGLRRSRRLGSSPAGAPTADLRCPPSTSPPPNSPGSVAMQEQQQQQQ